MNRLADFVEQISDDFKSTFTVVDKDTLANMMGLPHDFPHLTAIIRHHIPGAQVWFHKTGRLGEHENYDIYLIKAFPRGW